MVLGMPTKRPTAASDMSVLFPHMEVAASMGCEMQGLSVAVTLEALWIVVADQWKDQAGRFRGTVFDRVCSP